MSNQIQEVRWRICYWISKLYGFKRGADRFLLWIYKKQISSSLHDLEIGDCMLICGKCVFDKANMHVNINYLPSNIIMKILIILLK